MVQRLIRERPDSTEQPDLIDNEVDGAAALDHIDREKDGIQRVGVPAHHSLQGLNDSHRADNGIRAQMRHGPVSPDAVDGDLKITLA